MDLDFLYSIARSGHEGKLRRNAKIDANQTQIVEALRRMGCSVRPTHVLGQGFPDAVCGLHGINLLIEIKDGSKPPSARKLTPDEQKFHVSWKGQLCIIESVDDAVKLVKDAPKTFKDILRRLP